MNTEDTRKIKGSVEIMRAANGYMVMPAYRPDQGRYEPPYNWNVFETLAGALAYIAAFFQEDLKKDNTE